MKRATHEPSPDALLASAESALAASRLSEGLQACEAAWGAGGALDDAWRLRCGRVLMHLRYRGGLLASAFELGRELLPLMRVLPMQPAERIELLRMTALAAAETGSFNEALALGHEAHGLASDAGDRVQISLAINIIAWVYNRLGDPWHAESLLSDALPLARETGVDQPVLFMLNNLVGVLLCSYYLQHDTIEAAELSPLLERALGHARECVALPPLQADVFARVTVFCNLGEVLVLMGELDEAEAVLGTANAMASAVGFSALQARIGANLGRLELRRGRPETAIELLQPVLQACEATPTHATVLRVHQLLWMCHAALGNDAAALRHLDRYHRLVHAQLLNQMRGRSLLFVARIEAEQAQLEVARERERAHQAEADARIDKLTGLGNRRALEDGWPPLVRRLQATSASMALAMLDVDHFKNINDTYGHSVGDAVLVTLAGLLRENLRGHDLIIRIGGEEFVLVLPEASMERALEVCERLRESVLQHDWSALGDGLVVTASIGLTTAPPYELGPLVETADAALYAAKSGGRNRVCNSS